MTYLVFDTETTGLVNFSKPIEDASQPKLVQLAMQLFEDDGSELASLSTIVQPRGWIIPEAASNVHGITTEKALKCGVSLETALEIFSEFFDIADLVIAHNLMFDEFVMKHQFSLLDFNKNAAFKSKPRFCTKDATTNILKIPKATGGYKWPKLSEAYKAFFGEELEGAHDALVDTRACSRIYRYLIENNLAKPVDNR